MASSPVVVGICAAVERVSWGVWNEYEVTLVPRTGQKTSVEGGLVFVGYEVPEASVAAELKGKVAVFFNNTPAGLSGAERDGFAAKRARALASHRRCRLNAPHARLECAECDIARGTQKIAELSSIDQHTEGL